MNYRWLFYEFLCWLQQLVCVGHSYLYGIYCSVGFSSCDFLITFCLAISHSPVLLKECKDNTTGQIETCSSLWSIRFEVSWFTRGKNGINKGSLFSFFVSFVYVTCSSATRLHILLGSCSAYGYRQARGRQYMNRRLIYFMLMSGLDQICTHARTLNFWTPLLAPWVLPPVPGMPLASSWSAERFRESLASLCVVVLHFCLPAEVFHRCEKGVCQLCCLALSRLG